MTTQVGISDDSADALQLVEQALDGGSQGSSTARAALLQLADTSLRTASPELSRLAVLIARLLEIAECLGGGSGSGNGETKGIFDFCRDALTGLRTAIEGTADIGEAVRLHHEASARWGDYLELLPGEGPALDDERSWQPASPSGSEATDTAEPFPQVDTARLLKAFSRLSSSDSLPAAAAATPQEPSPPPSLRPTPPQPDKVELEQELLGAYLSDASQCLASMEQAALALEGKPDDGKLLRQFCRDLHTLKGASATVGVNQLARYLHETEDYLDQCRRGNRHAETDVLLQCIDAVRAQAQILGAPLDAAIEPGSLSARGADSVAQKPPPVALDAVGNDPGEFVRVDASRLDRLMDLLADLVMLRNRRDRHIVRLKHLQGEWVRCVTRLRTLDEPDQRAQGSPLAGNARSGARATSKLLVTDVAHRNYGRWRSRTVAELAADMSQINRDLRAMLDPLAEENLSISRVIGQYRQELIELRRMPVAGLFRRLHRGAREAARAEGKQLTIELLGEDVRIERALQERLYEPLLHLVRNAVSHGLETPEKRRTAGKPDNGTVTLEAHSDAASLVVEVRDDGRGLDYEGLERKGRELGLIPLGAMASPDQLAELIFRPGFSTRDQVSEVSGRGVGMDVVLSQIGKLRGRVEIDSTPGRGTTIRLRLALRSVIEHAMIVRVDGQLFALPIPFVHGTHSGSTADTTPRVSDQSARDGDRDLTHATLQGPPTLSLRTLLGLNRTARPEQATVLKVGRPHGNCHGPRVEQATDLVSLTVDAVVGAEEVVVRSLPPLLRGHRLFAGLTLSGDGESVLLFDVAQLLDLAVRSAAREPMHDAVRDQSLTPDRPETMRISESQDRPAGAGSKTPVLVVDDSVSTRRHLVRILASWDVPVEEAADGVQALEKLRSRAFSAVITDLEMPRLGGLELLAEIKRGRHRREIPVIVVTSRDDPATADRARSLGADGFLSKPVSARALADALGAGQFVMSTAST